MAAPALAFWTEERIAKLKQLWMAGYSGGQIAVEIGATRNMVIGKVHRLKMEPRSQSAQNQAAAMARAMKRGSKDRPKDVLFRRRVKPRNPNVFTDGTERTELKPDPVPGRFHLLELEEHQCRWPSGHADNGTHLFCGETRFPGSSYCECHAYRATDRVGDREGTRPHAARTGGFGQKRSVLVL